MLKRAQRFGFLLVLLTSGLSLAQSEKLAGEPVFQDLGNGYRIAHVSVDLSECKTCLESIAHYIDLYDGSKRLGRVGNFDLSPSGRFAVWEDHSPEARKFDGRLLLYDRKSGIIKDVAPRPFLLPRDFEWLRAENELKIVFYAPKGTKTITKILVLNSSTD